jgi:hypothetical protein
LAAKVTVGPLAQPGCCVSAGTSRFGRAAYAAAAAVDASVPCIAWVAEHNLPSRRVAERLGLTNYGLAVDPDDDRPRLAYADRPIGTFGGRLDEARSMKSV